MSIRDVLDIFGVSESTLYRWIQKKKMPCVVVNEQYRFHPVDLLGWALEQKVALTPRLLALSEQNGAGPGVLSGALKRGGIFYGVEGRNKKEALERVVGLIPLPSEADRPPLLEMLMARESLESTALGNGIAIPHVKNPLVLDTQEAMANLCFLKSPVDFGAFDGKPVSILFTLVSPSVKTHLAVLSRLAFCLQDPGFLKCLHDVAPQEEILARLVVLESKRR